MQVGRKSSGERKGGDDWTQENVKNEENKIEQDDRYYDEVVCGLVEVEEREEMVWMEGIICTNN